jgi:hypothetical protein
MTKSNAEVKVFKPGQPVFYCDCFGPDTQVKTFRYGTVRAGFIMEAEYIEARDQYLYTVGRLDNNKNKVYTKILGQHMVFDHSPAGYFKAITQVEELCEEVEDEE